MLKQLLQGSLIEVSPTLPASRHSPVFEEPRSSPHQTPPPKEVKLEVCSRRTQPPNACSESSRPDSKCRDQSTLIRDTAAPLPASAEEVYVGLV